MDQAICIYGHLFIRQTPLTRIGRVTRCVTDVTLFRLNHGDPTHRSKVGSIPERTPGPGIPGLLASNFRQKPAPVRLDTPTNVVDESGEGTNQASTVTGGTGTTESEHQSSGDIRSYTEGGTVCAAFRGCTIRGFGEYLSQRRV